jgi:hypothetical protein
MEEKIKEYINELFIKAPQTTEFWELKTEILRNTLDRYHDNIVDGKSPEIAYQKAIDQIGDLEELFTKQAEIIDVKTRNNFNKEDVIKAKHKQGFLAALAIFLYINCLVPLILLVNTSLQYLALALMFVMIAAATALLVYNNNTKLPKYMDIVLEDYEKERMKKAKALRTALGVAFCILSVVPLTLLDKPEIASDLGAGLMFIFIGLGVALFVYNGSSSIKFENRTLPLSKEYKKWEEGQSTERKKLRIWRCIIWLAAIGIYLVMNVLAWSWTVTWPIFLLALALSMLAKSLILKNNDKTGVILWSIVSILFLIFLIGSIILGMFTTNFTGFSLNLGTVNYENSDMYNVGETQIQDNIQELELNWRDGNLTVEVYDGDTLDISEEGANSEDAKLRYYIDGDKLIIQYCKAAMGLSSDVPHNKSLLIRIPAAKVAEMREIEIDSTSSEVSLLGLTVDKLDISNVSGDINVENCDVGSAEVDTVSADLGFSGKAGQIGFDSTSGNLIFNSNQQPEIVEASTVSGSVQMSLPANISGFTAILNSLSSNLETDFFTTVNNEQYVYGDGSSKFSLNTVSGKFSIMQIK